MTTGERELLKRWVLRSRKGPDITIQGDKMEGLGIDIVVRWQKEFQEDFCKYCVFFDLAAGRFERQGHDHHPEDCFYHWTDIVGICWNFKHRETNENISQMVNGDTVY